MEIFKFFIVYYLGCIYIIVNYMYFVYEIFKVLNFLLIWILINFELIWFICKISK